MVLQVKNSCCEKVLGLHSLLAGIAPPIRSLPLTIRRIIARKRRPVRDYRRLERQRTGKHRVATTKAPLRVEAARRRQESIFNES